MKLYLKTLFTIIFFVAKPTFLKSQVGINTSNPDPSSVLDITSTNKGLLVPRVTLTSVNDNSTIASPATGLLVWNKGDGGLSTKGFYYWDTKWNPIVNAGGGGSTGTAWSVNGNSAGSDGAKTAFFLGTTSYADLYFKVNNNTSGHLGTNGSVSFGQGSSAGQNSVAFGNNATSSSTANESVAVGASANAAGYQSVAIGYLAKTNSNNEIAIGNNAVTNGQNSSAIGYNSSATGYESVAIGYQSQAIGQNSSAIGYLAKTNNNNEIAIGNNAVTNGQNSSAIGYNSSATGYNSVALGYNTSASASNSAVLGNGASTSQSNAIILGDSNANVGIGTSTPSTSAKLDVNGNVKLGAKGSIQKNQFVFSVQKPMSLANIGAGKVVSVDLDIPSNDQPSSTSAAVSVNRSSGSDSNFAIVSSKLISTAIIRIYLMNITDAQQSLYYDSFSVMVLEY